MIRMHLKSVEAFVYCHTTVREGDWDKEWITLRVS